MQRTTFCGRKIDYQLQVQHKGPAPQLMLDHDSETELYCTQLARPQPRRNRSTDRIKFPNVSNDAPTVKKRLERNEPSKGLRCKSKSYDALRFKKKHKSNQKHKSKSKSKDGKKSIIADLKQQKQVRKPLRQLNMVLPVTKKNTVPVKRNKLKEEKQAVNKKGYKTDRALATTAFPLTSRSGLKSHRVKLSNDKKKPKKRRIIPQDQYPSRLQQQCAAILIQAHLRAFLARRDYKVITLLHNAARIIQKFWRRKRIQKQRANSNQPVRLQEMSAIQQLQKQNEGSNSIIYQRSAQHRIMLYSQKQRIKSPNSARLKISPFELPLSMPGMISPSSKGLLHVLNEQSINLFIQKRQNSIQKRIQCQKSLIQALSLQGALSPRTSTNKLKEVQNWYARQTASLQASKHDLFRGMHVFKETLKNIENDLKTSDLISHAKDHRQAMEMLDSITKEEQQLRTPIASKSPKDQIHISNDEEEQQDTPADRPRLTSADMIQPQQHSFYRDEFVDLQIDSTISFVKDYLSDLALFIKLKHDDRVRARMQEATGIEPLRMLKLFSMKVGQAGVQYPAYCLLPFQKEELVVEADIFHQFNDCLKTVLIKNQHNQQSQQIQQTFLWLLFEYFNEMLFRQKAKINPTPWHTLPVSNRLQFEQACAEIIESTASEGLRVCGIITDASLAQKLDEQEIARQNLQRMQTQLKGEIQHGQWEYGLDVCEQAVLQLDTAGYVFSWLVEEALLSILTICDGQQ